MELNLTAEHLGSLLLAAIPAIINLLLASYVFFRLPRRFITDIFGLLMLSSAGWQASAALMRASDDVNTALFFDNVFSPMGFFAAPLVMHFAFLIRNKDKRPNTRLPILLLSYGVTFMLAMIYPEVNTEESYLHSDDWGWINTRQGSVLHSLLGIVIEIQFLAAMVIFIQETSRTEPGTKRRTQMLLMTIPLICVILQTILTEVIFPVALKWEPLPITSLVMSLFSICAFIALTRYSLFQGLNDLSKEDLLSQVSDIIIIIDENLVVSYINKPGLEWLGHTEEDVTGQPVENILDCEHTESGDTYLTHAHITKIANQRCHLKAKDGTLHPILVSAGTLSQSQSSLGYILSCRNIADIEAAQEEIRKNERRFKKIIEKSRDAMAMVDTEGRITYMTQAISGILGYQPEEVTGRHFLEMIHPDSIEESIAVFRKNIGSPDSTDVETIYKALHKNGYPVYIEAVGVNHLEDPDIEGLVVVFRDVTGRYNIQQEREKSLALFKSLIQAVNTGILVEDQDRKIFAANQSFCRFFSIPVPPERLAGADWNSLAQYSSHLLPDPEAFAKRMSQIIEEKKPIYNELLTLTDGRLFERDYFPIRTDNGKFMGHIWRYVDVTTRKRMERELIEKNKILELTQEIGEMGSWIADLKNNQAVWSEEALEIYGLTEEEFDGKASTYFSFVHPDDLPRVNQIQGEATIAHKPFGIEHRIILRDGTERWIYSRAFIQYEEDTPVRMMGIVQDITRRKQNEQALISQNEELAKANAELDKFVYSASHDIRSPLMSILGLVHLAHDETEDPGIQLYFKMIEDRVRKLDEFTLDIIHYSRNSRSEVLQEEIHVKELLTEVLESLRYQEIAQPIDFQIDVAPGLMLCSDRARLQIVLSNIVSNAIKYRRDIEHPIVRLSAAEADEKVIISVEDNGEGIPQEKLDKVFEMFTRFSERSKGSGLGLYIVKEITDKLNGKIEVESKEGEGSVFRVVLPKETRA